MSETPDRRPWTLNQIVTDERQFLIGLLLFGAGFGVGTATVRGTATVTDTDYLVGERRWIRTDVGGQACSTLSIRGQMQPDTLMCLEAKGQ